MDREPARAFRDAALAQVGNNPYSPHTDADRRAMLARIGAGSVDDLLTAVPLDARGPALGVPRGMSEAEVQAHLEGLAALDRSAGSGPYFIGGPVQRRYIPAAVPVLALRGEFLTAYTPYQPEVSQGTLQAIWEYQSLMSELLGMDVVNSSMYEGSTALAEAALMAVRVTGRSRVVVAGTVFSQFRETLATYAQGPEIEVVVVPAPELATAAAGAACLIVQHPDAFGTLVDVRAVADAAHAAGALCVQVTEPHANALLEPPGAQGVDIAVGEGQPLGIPMSFGGPHLGIIACRDALVRQLPGRIVGQTVDANGTRGFVNTLQTREQHIRREKATSNICTNEAIAAIIASIYLSLMGPEGLRAAARLGVQRAHRLADRLGALSGCSAGAEGPFFDRFVLRTPLGGELRDTLLAHNVLVGGPIAAHYRGVADGVILQCTELTTDAEEDVLVSAVERATVDRPVASR
ncbi:MAG TPA: aminomethyl-transferring glycine dehydrogenase subunit GcvPA [Candidatus Limnocylindria bacterium]|nr:aminomethyl-transferring glycine dehydrogenase subunit GcvPA [Candidatus Limnocylindria bacterium]